MDVCRVSENKIGALLGPVGAECNTRNGNVIQGRDLVYP